MNPSLLIESGVQGCLDPKKQTQINGIDLTVGKIARFDQSDSAGCLDFDNSERRLPRTKCIYDSITASEIILTPGAYLLEFAETIQIPMNACGIVFPRSTLMRCGSTLHSAVWDSGYIGKGSVLLDVSRNIRLKGRARIAQIVFVGAESEGKYEGIYQGEGIKNV